MQQIGKGFKVAQQNILRKHMQPIGFINQLESIKYTLIFNNLFDKKHESILNIGK
jgi:hypothetical protein